MEQILQLLETASKNIIDTEGVLKEIAKREDVLDIELDRVNELSDNHKKLNTALQERRLSFIIKLSLVFSKTVGRKSYRLKENVISRFTIIPTLAGGPYISFDHSDDRFQRISHEGPEFFVERGYEQAYYSLCHSMIQTLKEYIRDEAPKTLEQSQLLNGLLEEVLLLSKT